MPPLANKGKSKPQSARRSRSRNTTPSSVISAGAPPTAPASTPYLEIDTAKLLVSSKSQYNEILDHLDAKPGAHDPKHLADLVELLRALSESAEARAQACDAAMRELAARRKDIEHEERERERAEREADAQKVKVKRHTDDAEDETSSKRGFKPRKRKDRSCVQEEKPVPLTADHVQVKIEGRWLLISLPVRSFLSLRFARRCGWPVVITQPTRLQTRIITDIFD